MAFSGRQGGRKAEAVGARNKREEHAKKDFSISRPSHPVSTEKDKLFPCRT